MVTDSSQKSPMWLAREREGLSREKATRRLSEPVSTKTLERWERGITPAPRSALRELAEIYRVDLADIEAAA